MPTGGKCKETGVLINDGENLPQNFHVSILWPLFDLADLRVFVDEDLRRGTGNKR